MSETTRKVQLKPNYDSIAWQWMRYSAILLIPLAWGHILIQDVLVGVHQISLDYVAQRWAFWGWRAYDFLLLAFAFAHGVNQRRIFLLGKLRIERFLDVTDIGAANIVPVNEGVHVAELQLDGGAHVVETHHLGEGIDDFQSPVEPSPMVVGHFQHEKVFENIAIDHGWFTQACG